jgi:LuxR family maltose regulon positive regulatory protein
MSLSLLSTKLYIPPARPNAVARPRLTEKLTAGLEQPGSITLLSGPAGFGKTTLLSAWITDCRLKIDDHRLWIESSRRGHSLEANHRFTINHQQSPIKNLQFAWVSLDEGDNDPIRFWTYLIAACQSIREGVGESALALFRMPQPLPSETVPTILINDLAGVDRDLVLILDDYHTIENETIHTALGFLLEHLPGKLHLVVSTRVDPPWPLARFRARNQLVEIRTRDLRFSTEEAALFLNQTTGLNLSAEDIAALEARTEGWIAGLQLAAIAMQSPVSLQGRSDLASFVKAFTGSHLYVAEYLVEEVLQRQPEDVQAFLLRTSLLERLNAELCNAVTGRQDGQEMLVALHRANLFVLPLDDEGRWFRYHHLFTDLLRSRLQQVISANEIVELHRRAAVWYVQNGFKVEAVNHALAARDFEEAARLIEQAVYPMLARGELATCMQWISSLPEDVTRQRPLFLLAKAWALTFAGSFHQVEPLLQQVEVLIQKEPDNPAGREMLGGASAMRAFFAMLAGEYERALKLAENAQTLSPESSTGARSLLPYTLGVSLRGQGKYELAAQAFARDIQMGERFDDLLIWATGITELVNTRRMQGRLREAVETGRQALRWLAGHGALQFGSLAKVEVALCEVLREKNELDQARERVGGAIDRMQTWAMPTDRLFAYLVLARTQESRGDFDGARASLQIARKLRDAHPVLMNLARAVDMYEIRLLLATRDVAAAESLLESLKPGTSRILVLREQELTMLGRVRLAQNRPGEAAEILSQLASAPGIMERMSAWLEVSALQACALDAQGNRGGAIDVLMKALAFAEPEGFVRLFADEGEAMRLLIDECRLRVEKPGQERLRNYIDLLLNAFPTSEMPGVARQRIIHQQSTISNLVEPLTPRELEVLQLITAGDSNRAIAEKLVITVSAVKKHTANIYGKLNVNSRTQAVARARQLGLLSADG